MSLKEALERDQMRQAEAAKTRDSYRKMFEEAGISFNKNGTLASYESIYKDTLPVRLGPEHQALVNEFVELCPSRAWKTMPEKPDEPGLRCFWDSNRLLVAEYRGGGFQNQIKLSDGSIHIHPGQIDIRLELGSYSELVGHRFLGIGEMRASRKAVSSGWERARLEAQRQIDRIRQAQYGTGGYVCLRYYEYEEERSADIFIFREKTVFGLNASVDLNVGFDLNAEFSDPIHKERFENWLLVNLKTLSE